MKQITIGIVGQGFVGNAIKEGFSPYYQIRAYDKFKPTYDTIESVVEYSDVIFVCVPTPMTETGECYTGIVESVLEDINDSCNNLSEHYKSSEFINKICIIKSTVPPGTTKRMNELFSNLNVIFSPEFLTEANAVNDFKNQNRIILGGLNKVTAKVKPIFAKVFPNARIVKTDSKYAEMVKYVTNTFLATKVSFANEINQICEALEIDYDKVIEYAQHDDRLGKSHWSVPGPDGDLGYGGHCFPKDLMALIHLELQFGINPTMLAATMAKNDEVREERDWESMEGRAVIKQQNFKEVEGFDSIETMRNDQGAPRRTGYLNSDEIDFSDPNQLKLKI